MKKSIIKILKYMFFISLGLLLLYFAFRGIDFERVKGGLLEADYSWIALSFAFSILAFISRARRWILLINPLGYNPSLKNSFLAMMTGYLANIALPRVGEVTKCVALGKREKIPVDQLVGTVIVERTIDLISLLAIMVLMLLISSETISTYISDNIIYPAQLRIEAMFELSIILGVTLIVISAALLYLLFKFRKKIASVKIFSWILTFSKGIIDGIKAVLHLKRKKEFILLTLFIWLNYTLMTWVVVFALKSTSVLTFTDALFILVIGSLAMAVPVQSGFGVFHLIISKGLSAVYGITPEDGLVYAIISHETQIMLIAVLGSVSFAILFMGNKKDRPL